MYNPTRISLPILCLIIGALALTGPLFAHHGSAISYDMDHPWTGKVVVTEFRYENPHPTLLFDRVNEKGETEHWVSELLTNPSFLIRAGWSKSRSMAALKPGTTITATVYTSKVGGTVAAVGTMLNEKGEEIVTSRAGNNPLRQGATGNVNPESNGAEPPAPKQ
jgi:hypothetical protein